MAFMSPSEELYRTTVLVEDSTQLEKLIAADGLQKWKFVPEHYKKIYPFTDARSLENCEEFGLSDSRLQEEKQLHAMRHLLKGACELAVVLEPRGVVRLQGSGFWLSPPVTATADLCNELQLDETWEGNQVLLFSSAWHVSGRYEELACLSSPTCVSSFMGKERMSTNFKILANPVTPRYPGVLTNMRSPSGTGGRDQLADFIIGIMMCDPEVKANANTFNVSDKFFGGYEPFWRTPCSPFADVDHPTPAERNRAVAICGYPGDVSEIYLRETYDVPYEIAPKVHHKVSETLLVAKRLSVAAGDMIAASPELLKHTCSSVPGMTGSALFPVDQPRTAYGIQVRRAFPIRESVLEAREHNFNYAFSLDADVYVLNYVRFVLPG